MEKERRLVKKALFFAAFLMLTFFGFVTRCTNDDIYEETLENWDKYYEEANPSREIEEDKHVPVYTKEVVYTEC